MDALKKELIDPIDEQISSLTAAIERLGLDLKMLEHARKFGRNEPMFASEMKVSKSLQEYETLLGDLQKYGTKPALSFERNKRLTDILKNVDTLGSLQGDMKVAVCPERGVHPHLKIQSSGQVDIAISHDKSKPWASGCCFMPCGYLVICDYENDRILLLDKVFVLIDKLELKIGSPYDMAVIDHNNVITTVPMRKQIVFIQIFPKMKAGKPKVIQLDGQCYGVCVSGGKIYTSLAENSEGEVRILGLDGNLEKRITVNQDGTLPLRSPNYLAVSKTGKEIFVADWRADTVTCISVDGQIIYQCKDANVKGPRGVYVDAGNNVYVCGSDTNNVGIITADGRLWKSLASSKEGTLSPCSIAFRSSDRALVVGCSGGTKLCCFKLE